MLGTAGRRKDKLMSNILQWTLTYGHTSVGQLATTYIYQLCVNTGCCQEARESVLSGYHDHILYQQIYTIHFLNILKCFFLVWKEK